ncbi:hypothetical protein KTS45_13080 [Halomicroarcula limicola]|uniref:Uncharacterized protein n=1 Tax=Haloarcula limicola TaxID=1429915 RepID=A0A8J7YDB8_9EURY|nr:hypothetical protein [Halomicroarcula limicola]MBV0925131.1 hypothetical protein [Halomicroarcula limicola]
MTGEFEPRRERSAAPIDDRYAALRVDGDLLVYDREDDGAWIQSSTTRELRA